MFEYPFILLKRPSDSCKAVATHRMIMDPLLHLFTFLVYFLIIPFRFSMMLVDIKDLPRADLRSTPRRIRVRVSSNPSRMDLAAEG